MNFKYSCIGDNTPDNREWLEKVGYKKWIWVNEDDYIPFISTMPECKEYAAFTQDEVEGFTNDIDCRSNPELFRSVTAMRDDSDYMQWFVCDKDYIDACNRDIDSKGEFRESFDVPKKWKHFYHKATLEELINHFSMDVCPDNNPMKVFRKKA